MSRRPVASFGQQCSRQKRVSCGCTVRRVPWHLPFWGCVYNFNFRYLVWLLGRIMNLENMYQKNETIVAADDQQPLITNVTKRFPLWGPRYLCFRQVTTSHAWPCHRQKRSDEKTRRLNRCGVAMGATKNANSSFSALAVGLKRDLFFLFPFSLRKVVPLFWWAKTNTERSSFVSKTDESWHRFRRNKGRPSVKQRT